MSELFAPFLNFLILVGFLAVKLKQPLSEFIATRHSSIRDEIRTVHEQLREAQEKNDEFTSKLKAIDAELTALWEQSKQETLQIRQKIMTEAQRLAGFIISDSKASAENLYGELRAELYLDLVSQVLRRTETLVQSKISADDRARLQGEFSRQIKDVIGEVKHSISETVS